MSLQAEVTALTFDVCFTLEFGFYHRSDRANRAPMSGMEPTAEVPRASTKRRD